MSKKPPNSRKVCQFVRQVEKLISDNGGVDSIFRNFDNKPDLESTVDLFKSGKYGLKNPFECTSVEFALEYAFHEFNEIFSSIERDPNWENQSNVVKDWNVFFRAQDEPWGNLAFTIWVDKTFSPFVSPLDRKEFINFTDLEYELIHDYTRSIVFDLKYNGVLEKRGQLYERMKQKMNFSESEYKSKTIFHYSMWIASADLYDEFSEPNNLNRRKSLIDVKVPWDGSSNYIVYLAKDSEGVARYVGEGQVGRESHINSGKSHNVKVNEHYFKKGKMAVTVVRNNLTKPRALAVEKFLISKHRRTLWNIKDNPDAKKS